MSYVIDHYLKAPNLKKILLESGVIESKVLHGVSGREVAHAYALNMKRCNEQYWSEVERAAKEHGVIDFSKKNEDGKYGVRRDLTAQEIEELPYWPVFFNKDDEVNWICKWRNNDDPAYFISKLFPSVKFEYYLFYEGDWDGGYTVTDGVFDTTEEWEKRLEEIRQEREAAYDEVDENEVYVDESKFESDDTLPF